VAESATPHGLACLTMAQAALAFGAAGDFNRGLGAVGEVFFRQRVNGVVQEVLQDEIELGAARPDLLARRQVDLERNFFVA